MRRAWPWPPPTSSRIVLYFSGETTKRNGVLTSAATPAKSRSGSNGSVACVAGNIVSADECDSSAYPSASALATAAGASVPPPPPRFSMMNGWPSCCET